MEKLRPHFPLQEIIRLASNTESVVFTTVARKGAATLGMAVDDMFTVLAALTMRDFYKSMTSYADHTSWQDVYRPLFQGTPLYLKLTIIPERNLLVVSFKRR
ncbi:MAG: type II toxin-antitoxin system MqsR family toxin [Deltaproteobacteria bacterium]|nr:type II toxin-antitoxin system MqsR family toxin [Deltaproteobacteria bacterium]